MVRPYNFINFFFLQAQKLGLHAKISTCVVPCESAAEQVLTKVVRP